MSAAAVALVGCLALLNALRRSIFEIVEGGMGPLAFVESWAQSLLIGFTVLFAVTMAMRAWPRFGRRQAAAVAAAVVVGSGLGVLGKDAWELHSAQDVASGVSASWYFLNDWLRYAVLCAMFAAAYVYFRLEAQNEALRDQCAVDTARLEGQMAEARLRLLEAQIEPHFLFNSLAGVRHLMRSDPATADHLLEQLAAYFATALPHLRHAQSTLDQEAVLARAFLAIHAMRLGRRLTFRVDVPPTLGPARIPPFTLLTLLENAVKHGISRSIDGGTIDVVATASDGRLRLEVRDTGAGFTGRSGAGTGLANVRSRLTLLYGPRAWLRLAGNDPRGVVAMVELPLDLAVAR